jgi:hypothetical protein
VRSVPGVKTKFAKRVFRVAVPHIWNALPVNVQSGQSVLFLNRDFKLFCLKVNNFSDMGNRSRFASTMLV